MKPVHDLDNGPAHGTIGQFRPVDHDDGDAQRAGSKDLRLGSSPACVLGNQQLGAVRAHQFQIVLKAEGSASNDHLGVWKGEVRGGRIDQPGQETMLSEVGEAGEMLSTDRQKYPLAGAVQCSSSPLHVGDMSPSIALFGHPGHSFQCAKRHSGACAGKLGVPADPGSKGMGRIDHLPDAVCPQEGRKPLGPAEAAAADGHRLPAGVGDTSRIRQDRGQARVGNGLRKAVRLGGATQNEGGSDV